MQPRWQQISDNICDGQCNCGEAFEYDALHCDAVESIGMEYSRQGWCQCAAGSDLAY